MTFLLAVIISLCGSITSVSASVPIYELVNWKTCLACLRGCKLEFEQTNKTPYSMSDFALTKLENLVKKGDLLNAYYFVGEIYDKKEDVKNYQAVNCCMTKNGNYFKAMLDEYVATKPASIIDYDAKKWILVSETVVIAAVSAGIIVYKKKKHHLEDEKIPVE